MEFENNISANFTTSAFTSYGRKTCIMGSHGYIEGQEQTIKVLNFSTQKWTEYDIDKLEPDVDRDHGGGDQRLVQAFINSVRSGKRDLSETGLDTTLESHLIAFAAEKARIGKRVVNMEEMYRLY